MATVNITSKVNELMCWGPAPLHPAVYCYAIHTPIPLAHLGPLPHLVSGTQVATPRATRGR